jgi:hypothetical protein
VSGISKSRLKGIRLNRVSKRGEAPLFNILPLSFEGEGDKAGSQENRRFFWVLKGGKVENNLSH